ncbi:GH1 family beta-glucosidase [Rariglobus hedericola]|uniref:Beta-glucosidase n=1 Tax=Rariglobus hedericola TaxID=2597822 RepID=A0A556QMU2_9BACT|nr:GH1 family beta-glucosidase [Rariglobus hedericola]TSJ77955.1 beta-glucosidase [Rariglobus hedericola]
MPIKPKPLTFPKNFVWGVATAAAQIEGAAFEDGKGESIWDRFARIPGKVLNGDTLDVANDHYHRYPQDFALMRKLGIKNYRLSVSWPRIYPNGDGEINPKGLEFYNKLINSCLKHGITPWVTLFHWDLPQSLEDRGGWTNRATADAFAVYAETVVKALSDRVKNWITLNEIVCFTLLGYSKVGDKAPGRKESEKVVNQTYHHALLCHGHAVKAVRNFGGKGARVGITDNSAVPIPVTETPADIAAARAWFIEKNSRILEPIYTGRYSADHKKRMGADMPDVQKGDLGLISLPTDFLGLNIYTGAFVRAAKGKRYEELPLPADFPRSSCPWLNIMPQVLYWGTRLPAEIYKVPAIYITENGCGYDVETLTESGEVHDLHRRDLVRNYLHELHRAIADGVPVKGYFLWSFMDNYEWQDGYTRRFGIVHCDFKTQKRTPKTSAKWYAKVIAENRLV